MIYEYALDPALVLHWAKDIRDYRQFVNSFGLGTTRIRSSVPRFNRWRSSVLHMLSTDCDENYGNRVTELVNAIGENTEVHREVSVDKSRPWIDSVAYIDSETPFDYVLVDTVPAGSPSHFFTGDDIFLRPEDCWNHDDQKPVQRTAQNMASEVGNMLRLSRDFVFVDPYFNHTLRKRAAIEAFIDRIFDDRVEQSISSITILCSAEVHNGPSCAYIVEKLRSKWILKWGTGFKICIRSLREKPGGEQFHNRYVFTELGGVFFGIGLDEGEESQTDDMILLRSELYLKRWSQYFDCSAFDVVEEEFLEF